MFIIWTRQKLYLFLKCIRNTSSSYWFLKDMLFKMKYFFGEFKILKDCWHTMEESFEHLLVSSQQCLTPQRNI